MCTCGVTSQWPQTKKQQDAERTWMKEDDFYFHIEASFYCFVRYNVHRRRLRHSQVRYRTDLRNLSSLLKYVSKTLRYKVDVLKIVETEVRISQFTELKQAGMEIESGPRFTDMYTWKYYCWAVRGIISSCYYLQNIRKYDWRFYSTTSHNINKNAYTHIFFLQILHFWPVSR